MNTATSTSTSTTSTNQFKPYTITQADKDELSQILGPNNFSNELQKNIFFDSLQQILNKSQWKINDLKIINQLISDSMGFMIQTLFRDKAAHPLYFRYYANRIFTRHRSLDELKIIANKFATGEITEEELKNYGAKVSRVSEFVETNTERKDRLEKEKSIINNDTTATSKTHNKSVEYKSK